MQHLRIVGVNDEENMAQLILSDDSGQEFSLPIDEALRHAVTRPPVRPSQPRPATSPLTPREIQARLRAGATVDQVVAASGLTSAHVERYAGPVHAERSYIAQRARTTQVAPASAAEAHRLAFGDEPADLENMVNVRLRAMDVDLSTLSWDSWRREDGLWQVTCVFDVDSSATHGAGIGLKPPAEWSFQPDTRQLRAINRWAESLSALSATVPTPRKSESEPQGATSGTGRRLSAVDAVFNVEETADPRGLGATAGPAAGRPQPEAGTRGARTSVPRSGARGETAQRGDAGARGDAARRGGTGSRGDSGARGEGHEHEDLLDVLRARRGQRLGADAEADDRLALMLNKQDPQDRDSAATPADPGRTPTESEDEEHSTVPIPRLRPVQNRAADDTETADSDVAATETRGAEAGEGSKGSEGPEESPWGAPTADAPQGTSESDTGPHDGRLDAWGFAYEGEPEDRSADAGEAAVGDAPADRATEPTEPEDPAEKPRKRTPARRASMPKWDDILFGSKND
ncbi:DUF3071 domain-containing protein [Nesterenkonia sp. E16_7]|uniref:septation protein SepH n=1 Tax=unclassified Nesterenkonia TaxID=2629769 RepID=UPI001A924B59|nr:MULTISPECIES: septation protein SepH [unclassified Nesterenkonia]MBO0596038.1 DUF3071 domain-containing protein [Nesterenkonia sp. E16_10]MBO0599362.1 DUF3071 domain-containing protein [Nesterenkonia sp. E16_7]